MVFFLVLAGCAEEPFTYSVSVPPNYVIEGYEGQSRVEIELASYDRAVEELSLVVTRTEQGTNTSRELNVWCGAADVGTPMSESVTFGTDSVNLYIDTRTCVGTTGGITIVDCGC